jgi:hypothetical protein
MRLFFHVGSLQPEHAGMCVRECVTKHKQRDKFLFSRPGCRRTAFSKWKSADVRAGTDYFLFLVSPVVDYVPLIAPLPCGIIDVHCRYQGPLTHFPEDLFTGCFPRWGQDVGRRGTRSMPKRKISASFALCGCLRWAGLYLVNTRTGTLQSSLAREGNAGSTTASPKRP